MLLLLYGINFSELCVWPFIIGTVCYLLTALKGFIVLGRKTYEKAGGVAEEIFYNIKTVTSFGNLILKMIDLVVILINAMN